MAKLTPVMQLFLVLPYKYIFRDPDGKVKDFFSMRKFKFNVGLCLKIWPEELILPRPVRYAEAH